MHLQQGHLNHRDDHGGRGDDDDLVYRDYALLDLCGCDCDYSPYYGNKDGCASVPLR